MAIYSIKDLEKLSDIKAHTIRMWEQRYAIVQPKRTPTNIRYYNDSDLKHILNIATLNKNGYKISKIAKMSLEEISQSVAELSIVSLENTTQLDALTISMIEMDENNFDRIISANVEQIGFERTMLEIINPFLEKLGLLWLTGSINPAQEHFISCLIRQKIIVAIDKTPFVEDTNATKFLLFLPEGVGEELSLLFLHYIMKVRGHRVIYLGQNIPFQDIRAVYNIHQPEYIYTIVTEQFVKEPTQRYIDRLSYSFPDAKILLSGYRVLALPLQLPENVNTHTSFLDTIQFLNAMLAQTPRTQRHKTNNTSRNTKATNLAKR